MTRHESKAMCITSYQKEAQTESCNLIDRTDYHLFILVLKYNVQSKDI